MHSDLYARAVKNTRIIIISKVLIHEELMSLIKWSIKIFIAQLVLNNTLNFVWQNVTTIYGVKFSFI